MCVGGEGCGLGGGGGGIRTLANQDTAVVSLSCITFVYKTASEMLTPRSSFGTLSMTVQKICRFHCRGETSGGTNFIGGNSEIPTPPPPPPPPLPP